MSSTINRTNTTTSVLNYAIKQIEQEYKDIPDSDNIVEKVIDRIIQASNNPPINDFEFILNVKFEDIDDINTILFHPITDKHYQYYAIFLNKAQQHENNNINNDNNKNNNSISKTCSLLITLIFLIHRKNNEFLRGFIVNDGITALVPYLDHKNLYIRGQALEIILSITDCEALYDWFTKPSNEIERKMHIMLLSTIMNTHTSLLIHKLLNNRCNSYPGGSYHSLQILAFLFSWVRALYTKEQILILSEYVLNELHIWSTTSTSSTTTSTTSNAILTDNHKSSSSSCSSSSCCSSSSSSNDDDDEDGDDVVNDNDNPEIELAKALYDDFSSHKLNLINTDSSSDSRNSSISTTYESSTISTIFLTKIEDSIFFEPIHHHYDNNNNNNNDISSEECNINKKEEISNTEEKPIIDIDVNQSSEKRISVHEKESNEDSIVSYTVKEVDSLRKQGNIYFQQEKYKVSIECYMKALNIIQLVKDYKNNTININSKSDSSVDVDDNIIDMNNAGDRDINFKSNDNNSNANTADTLGLTEKVMIMMIKNSDLLKKSNEELSILQSTLHANIATSYWKLFSLSSSSSSIKLPTLPTVKEFNNYDDHNKDNRNSDVEEKVYLQKKCRDHCQLALDYNSMNCKALYRLVTVLLIENQASYAINLINSMISKLRILIINHNSSTNIESNTTTNYNNNYNHDVILLNQIRRKCLSSLILSSTSSVDIRTLPMNDNKCAEILQSFLIQYQIEFQSHDDDNNNNKMYQLIDKDVSDNKHHRHQYGIKKNNNENNYNDGNNVDHKNTVLNHHHHHHHTIDHFERLDLMHIDSLMKSNENKNNSMGNDVSTTKNDKSKKNNKSSISSNNTLMRNKLNQLFSELKVVMLKYEKLNLQNPWQLKTEYKELLMDDGIKILSGIWKLNSSLQTIFTCTMEESQILYLLDLYLCCCCCQSYKTNCSNIDDSHDDDVDDENNDGHYDGDLQAFYIGLKIVQDLITCDRFSTLLRLSLIGQTYRIKLLSNSFDEILCTTSSGSSSSNKRSNNESDGINVYDDKNDMKNCKGINSKIYSDMITVNAVKSMKIIKNLVDNML